MRTLIFLFLLGCFSCCLTACVTDLNEGPINDPKGSDLVLQVKGSNYLEIPFKAKFQTRAAEDSGDGLCSFVSPQDFWRKEHQVGSGNATHIGNFTTDLRFCFHIVLNDEGLPDFEGGFGEFTGSVNIITANNGDQLFTKGNGSSIMPIQDEKYVLEFKHNIDVIGGTGRFENASGGFINYGKVRSDGSGTDHVHEGIIILKRPM
ncbi:hypothetical protein [Echinicola salinicaeni]|uniref:hypothetical protein n=1 Tax=Echinicola salinicaeni TaxID=2762757 RepID=UPI001644ACE4|nr:hypothetical protein [Echinicola salinicaeni]